jgi:hypothetical protein
MAIFTRTVNTQDSRMIQKLSTVTGQVPTVAPSDNHVDGTWDSLDIYIGELFMNAADGKMWCRTNNGIKEIFVVPSNAATGDVFYINGGTIQKLAIGTSGQVLAVSSGGVPVWQDDSGGTSTSAEVFQFRDGSPYITAQQAEGDNSALTSGSTGRRTQLMPIYVPVDCDVDGFYTETRSSASGSLTSFGIYSYTKPIESGQDFQLIGGATNVDTSSTAVITAAPDSPITLTKGWYMLAMFRNTAAAGQTWLQFANGALLPIFGWNSFQFGNTINMFYENTTTDLAAGTLPATINEDTDLDYSGNSNILAFAIRITPL